MELVSSTHKSSREGGEFSPVYWLDVDIRLLINEAENFHLSVVFAKNGRHPHLTETRIYLQRRRAQTCSELGNAFIAVSVPFQHPAKERERTNALRVMK